MRTSHTLLRRCAQAAVRAHILGSLGAGGAAPGLAGAIPTSELLAGVHAYVSDCIVQDRQFEAVTSLLGPRLEAAETEAGELELLLGFWGLKDIHDALDAHLYRRYFALPCVLAPACLLLRLNGLVNSQFALVAQQLFDGSPLQPHLAAVLDSRSVRSRSLQLFAENCALAAPERPASAAARRAEARLRQAQDLGPGAFFGLLRAQLADALREAFRRNAASNDYHLFARVLPLDTGRLLQLLLATLQGARIRGPDTDRRLPHFDELLSCLFPLLAVAIDAQLFEEPHELDELFANPRVLEQLASIAALGEAVPALRSAHGKELELLRQLAASGAPARRGDGEGSTG